MRAIFLIIFFVTTTLFGQTDSFNKRTGLTSKTFKFLTNKKNLTKLEALDFKDVCYNYDKNPH